MGILLEQYKQLRSNIEAELHEIIRRKGVHTMHTIEKGATVKGDFYVDGRKITHITDSVLVAGGLHYQHDCLPIDELIELVENLMK